ncbi:S-adenosyl-L-methionine-dependent methyltransferase [Auricularia subglabra TFB-10046 SS5]|uniref:S-adenosyl-L-methionine-dependent methyltransferase n=1 Tax=Auricularia subglabra (strain TFB-10046 / SS5) TaxID=717982 RepID=J0CUR6_AURST|nr:S-adenosyl-L-methionine-dependent methyltransferase [Auricularia subglabra TFB-10046 SS5]
MNPAQDESRQKLEGFAAENEGGSCCSTSLRRPAQKFDNKSGLLALMGCTVDEDFKASDYLMESLTTPEIAKSDRPNDSAMCLAHGIKDPGRLLDGFGWKDLPKGSVIVDVGGGTGHVSMLLAKTHPQLKLVVQDRHQTIAHGRETKRVELQGHDFFDPQPPRDPPALYLLRFIVHDWADSYAAKILRRLREAAAPTTKLMLIERIIPYACKANDAEYRKSIPGTEDDSVVPKPLLQNLGVVNLNGYLAEIQRTLQEFDRLYAASGWKLVQVHKTKGLASQIIGAPA